MLKVDFGNFCQKIKVIQNRVILVLIVFYHMSLCQLSHFLTYLLAQVGKSKSFCTIYWCTLLELVLYQVRRFRVQVCMVLWYMMAIWGRPSSWHAWQPDSWRDSDWLICFASDAFIKNINQSSRPWLSSELTYYLVSDIGDDHQRLWAPKCNASTVPRWTTSSGHLASKGCTT